jgi:hypothetical protein
MDYSSTSGFDPAILSVCLYTESECQAAGNGNDVHRPGNPVLFGGLISDQSLEDDSDAQNDGQQLSTRPEAFPTSYTALQTENEQSRRSGLRSHSTDKIARVSALICWSVSCTLISAATGMPAAGSAGFQAATK